MISKDKNRIHGTPSKALSTYSYVCQELFFREIRKVDVSLNDTITRITVRFGSEVD